MTSAVHALSDRVHDALLALAPLDATLLGDHRFDAQISDVTPEGVERSKRELAAVRAGLEQAAQSTLSDDDRVTWDVADQALHSATHELDDRYLMTAAGPIASGAGIGSPVSALLAAVPKITLRDAAHAQAHLARCRQVPGWFADAEQWLRDGVGLGCAPAARLVDATVRQLDRYLALPLDRDPLVLDAPSGHPHAGSWRAELVDVVASVIRPALRRHRTVLADEIAPAGRADDAVGLLHLPAGEQLYADAVRVHTTTTMTAEEVHQLGLALVARLADEYRDLGGRVLGIDDTAAVFQRLRDDPALRFDDARQVRDTANRALRAAEAALSDWFGDVGTVPCEVRAIPELEAPESTIGYYQPPPIDGSRPGIYFVNDSEPHLRTRFEAEALAFHESVPGHHTQIATALQLDLPKLRRVHYLTAYAEGWALYVERLADQMGLYSDDRSRLGMLSFDSWRACRLVVDTGMHAFGWSRQQAVDFMTANSPQSSRNIVNEVDRYISWPGQALAYMVGRTSIVAARERARRALGARFDIAGFHDAVLGSGPVPLHTLDRLVDRWVDHADASR